MDIKNSSQQIADTENNSSAPTSAADAPSPLLTPVQLDLV
jgi:hypothetical protein